MLGGKLESLELPWYVGMMLRVAMQLLLRDHVRLGEAGDVGLGGC